MTRLHMLVEGPTEERFCKSLLGPYLLSTAVHADVIIIGKVSDAKGGSVTTSRALKDLGALLHDSAAHTTTMFDYYGRGSGFREMVQGNGGTPESRVIALETAFAELVREKFGDNKASRFIPHFQLHEFETLLFSNRKELARELGCTPRDLVPNTEPEDINDSPATAPSKRILALCPGYAKQLGGELVARRIGLEAMMQSCPHFAAWVCKLQALESSTV